MVQILIYLFESVGFILLALVSVKYFTPRNHVYFSSAYTFCLNVVKSNESALTTTFYTYVLQCYDVIVSSSLSLSLAPCSSFRGEESAHVKTSQL